MEQQQSQLPAPKEPSLDDVGTRYDHLREHYEALMEVCGSLLRRPALSVEDKQRLVKLTMASEVVKGTLDAWMGLSTTNVDYMMYRMLKTVPKNADDIPSERGTPLC